MLYDIRMTIRYQYPSHATAGRYLLRLMPAVLPGVQRVIAGSLTVSPEPVEQLAGRDFFGNETVEVALGEPHWESRFSIAARVERRRISDLLDVSPRPEDLARDIAAHATLDASAPHHFLGPSTRVQPTPEMTAFGREAASGSATVYEIIRSLAEKIHDEFAFDPSATEVDTPVLEAFEARHGVCQDFSHVMIGCLRGLGIPAGYVSGFLRTIPPEGQPRLEGADAMHAWVRAWCGHQMGWVEYDPTNAVEVARDHVVIATGRDYSDVAPIQGVMRSAGMQSTGQSVDVIPLD
ncbi:transglutaminase family protein [Tropicimonas sp. IMCC6043]|uniref:transglutaminase family protein n=1 Tax=Tropicimonas sp. IMCC6043 TaxID=2510645 RepID=UPI00101D32F3|nr:transglutaminase family protein [Tropicimonas sp. IMCC6043]RYH11145.1 transglutaminase family protein [Tropicimonas sp. IMCC6043]